MQNHEGLALYSLIKNSNPDALEVFLSKTKIDLNSPISSLQLLPIQIAFVLNSYNIIGILIKHGADPNFESLDLISPMFQSDSVWSEEMFNALLDHGTSIRELKFYGNLASHPIVLSIDTRHPTEITARLIANTIMPLDDWMKLLYYTLQKAHSIVSHVIHKLFSMPFTSPLDKRVQGLKVLKTLFTMLHNVTVETTVIHNILAQFDFIFADSTFFTSFTAPQASLNNPFTTLPNELVVSILNRLSVPILLRLSRTCKALHYYTRTVTSFDTSFRSLYSSLPRKHLVHTNYDLKKAAQLLFLINRFPNVTSAYLGSILVFPYAAQRIIDKWWSNGMKALTIRCLDRQKTLDLFNTAMMNARLLERLDLNCFQRGHDVFVETVRAFNHLPNLKYASIVSRHYRPPADVIQVSLASQSLLSLKLSGHHQYSSAKIVLTLDTPHLEYLSLINTTQQVNIRHTAQLHTLKLVANDQHQLDLDALAHLTELKLVFPGALVKPQAKFNRLRRLGIPKTMLAPWASIAPNLQELSLYYSNLLLPLDAPLSTLFPHVNTLEIHTEEALQSMPEFSVSTFKCSKFDFQYDTATNKFPKQIDHFWIRSSNIVTFPDTLTDKDGSLMLSTTLQSLHIYKTSTMSIVSIKQIPMISLIANSGSEIFIDMTNVQHLELLDNSNKITLQGDFSALRHLIVRRNTLIKVNDERETFNKRALLTFDVDIV